MSETDDTGQRLAQGLCVACGRKAARCQRGHTTHDPTCISCTVQPRPWPPDLPPEQRDRPDGSARPGVYDPQDPLRSRDRAEHERNYGAQPRMIPVTSDCDGPCGHCEKSGMLRALQALIDLVEAEK